jgi:hypothetical protein
MVRASRRSHHLIPTRIRAARPTSCQTKYQRSFNLRSDSGHTQNTLARNIGKCAGSERIREWSCRPMSQYRETDKALGMACTKNRARSVALFAPHQVHHQSPKERNERALPSARLVTILEGHLKGRGQEPAPKPLGWSEGEGGAQQIRLQNWERREPRVEGAAISRILPGSSVIWR